MMLDTQAELSRRSETAKAEKEIRAILKKYTINISDINLDALRPNTTNLKSGRANSSAYASKKKGGAFNSDKRRQVMQKYKSLDNKKTWSGRGRAPTWVKTQCGIDDISIDEFKKDPRFKIE